MYIAGSVLTALSAYPLFWLADGTSAISIYIIVVSVIAIACTLALTETYRTDMEDIHS